LSSSSGSEEDDEDDDGEPIRRLKWGTATVAAAAASAAGAGATMNAGRLSRKLFGRLAQWRREANVNGCNLVKIPIVGLRCARCSRWRAVDKRASSALRSRFVCGADIQVRQDAACDDEEAGDDLAVKPDSASASASASSSSSASLLQRYAWVWVERVKLVRA